MHKLTVTRDPYGESGIYNIFCDIVNYIESESNKKRILVHTLNETYYMMGILKYWSVVLNTSGYKFLDSDSNILVNINNIVLMNSTTKEVYFKLEIDKDSMKCKIAYHQEAKYTPEPTWRSPFTMAVLTWISFAIAIGGLLPIGIKIVKSGLNVFNGTLKASVGFESQIHLIIFVILIILFVVFLSLRRIAKSQTRYPLFFNFAISGYGKRLTLEKIHIEKCPQCGGKMKYYNKPVEWREVQYSDGRRKRETKKRVPALECMNISV